MTPIAGGFLAAWFGARLAFRRTLRELALTGKVAWHEEAILSLAAYEEVLERLKNNFLRSVYVKSKSSAVPQSSQPEQERWKELVEAESFQPEPRRWKELVEAESRLRHALQLHEVYTRSDTLNSCSFALKNATLAEGQWFDLGPAPKLQKKDVFQGYQFNRVRVALQSELRALLQMDGWIRSNFPKLNKWLRIIELKRQLKKISKRHQKVLEKSTGHKTFENSQKPDMDG